MIKLDEQLDGLPYFYLRQQFKDKNANYIFWYYKTWTQPGHII